MRRNGLLVGGWAMATLLALVLGLQGIRSVSNSVTDHRPAPLSPASVRAALQRTNAPPSTTTIAAVTTATTAAGDVPAGSVSSSDVVVPIVNGDVGSTASGGPPATVASDVASSDSSAPSTSSADGGDGSSSSSQSSSDSSSAPYIDRVYQLDGGSVAVRYQNDAAHLLWATPNRDKGYAVDQAQEDGGTVDVRFRNRDTGAESRLRAYWDGGPQYEIEED